MTKKLAVSLLIITMVIITGCEAQPPAPEPVAEPGKEPAVEKPVAQIEPIDRESKIPSTQEKLTPATDLLPPILHSDEYEEPVPMPYPINTAGAEDSG